MSLSELSFGSKSKIQIICDEFPSISSSEEAILTINSPSNIAELLPECSQESSTNLFNSRDAIKRVNKLINTVRISSSMSEYSISSADEGSLRISNRIFLQDGGATKYLMNPSISKPARLVKVEPKILRNSDTRFFENDHSFYREFEEIKIPDLFSPLYRKIVICELEEDDRFKRLEIASCCTCSGFVAAPELEFSNIDKASRGFCHYQHIAKQILVALLSPEILGSFITTPIAWISCGFEHCTLVTTLGAAMSWGYGSSGCLGHGNTHSYTFPTLITDLTNKIIVYIECGAYHNAAVSADGELYL